MNERLLEDIGLTSGEVKVYFALVKLGSTKTGPLAKEAGVSSSKVYKILDRLEKRGIVGHIIKGEVKYFSASDPRRIIDYIEEKENNLKNKKEEIKKIIPEINSALLKIEGKSEAIIYEGFKGATNLFRNMLDEMKKGEVYYVIGASYGETSGLRTFFHNHHMRRAEKGIKLKMLANDEVRKNMESPTKENAEIRYLPSYLATKMEIVIYKNKSFIVLWTKNPVAFFIQNEEATTSFKAYFDSFWKLAKP
jgi:sugar-specific transcriptional regulator TrmB